MTRLILVIVIALSTVGHAAAQDRPVIFVHGFGSSGETWSGAASRLQTSLAIQPATPSLNARALYESQADDLQWQSGGLGSDAVAVGHSNGGLVARQWNRQHPLAGVITVGTPHGGAPLVRNLSAYAGFNWELVWSVNDVFRSFGQACCNWQWILSMYSNVWQLAADMAASSVPEIASAVAVNTAFPVTPEMAPGSSFLASINSSGNLTREAAAIPVRVGIVSTAYNLYGAAPCARLFPMKVTWSPTGATPRVSAWRPTPPYIYANAPYEDWWAFDIASGLSTAAWYLTVMDEWWCQSVSLVGLGACWVNDTIVPQWSQVYPGGLYIDSGWQGPAHTQETRMSDALIDRVLTTYLQFQGARRRHSRPMARQCSMATSTSAAARGRRAATRRSLAGTGTTRCRPCTCHRAAPSFSTSTPISEANRSSCLETMPTSGIMLDLDQTGRGMMWPAQSASSDRSHSMRVHCRGGRHGRAVAGLITGSGPSSSSLTPIHLHGADGWGRPAVHGSAVYYLSRHHELYAVDRDTGATKWRRTLHHAANRGTAGTSVVVERGRVIVGDDDLFAFDAESGVPRWRFSSQVDNGLGPYLGAAAEGVVYAEWRQVMSTPSTSPPVVRRAVGGPYGTHAVVTPPSWKTALRSQPIPTSQRSGVAVSSSTMLLPAHCAGTRHSLPPLLRCRLARLADQWSRTRWSWRHRATEVSTASDASPAKSLGAYRLSQAWARTIARDCFAETCSLSHPSPASSSPWMFRASKSNGGTRRLKTDPSPSTSQPMKRPSTCPLRLAV